MSTTRKLLLGFGALIALLALALLGVGLQLRELRRHAEHVASVAEPLNSATYEMQISALAFGVGALRYATLGEVDGRERALKRASAYAASKAEFDRLATAPAFLPLRQRHDELFAEYEAFGRRLIEERDRGVVADPQVAMQFATLRAQVTDFLEKEVHATARRELASANELAAARADDLLGTVLLLLALGAGLAVAIGVLTSRGVIRTERALTLALRDATAAETARRETEERLKRLNDSNIIGIVYTDDAGEIVEANEAFLEMVGYSRADLAAGKLRACDITPPEHAHLDARALVEARERGVCTAYEKEYLARDGKRMPVLLGCARLDGPGSGHICYVLDLSTRKTLEGELMRHAAQLKDADRRKDEFLATLAHELRNPLAPIRNALELMKRAGDDLATVAKARQMMERQLQLMVRMVDDLLDVSRITLGKITLERQRLELGRLLEVAAETVRPLYKAASQDLVVKLPDTPIFVDGDPARLAQVYSNLLNNASKYTPENGHVSVHGELDGRIVRVRIRDNGVGIAPEMLPRIFDLFTQVDTSLGRAQGGLGIGLTLVRNLVDIHGGTVTARSEGPGRGSEFVVELPAATDQDAALPALASDAISRDSAAPRRVLVVDDSRDAAASLGILLEITGNQVRLAHDGTAAIASAIAFRPDVMLLDIGMPGMNGHEVARRIRERGELSRTVLVAVTGWGTDEDRRRSREAGFDHHLVKPVNFDDLQRLLQQIGAA